jgi:hypothetical protein
MSETGPVTNRTRLPGWQIEAVWQRDPNNVRPFAEWREMCPLSVRVLHQDKAAGLNMADLSLRYSGVFALKRLELGARPGSVPISTSPRPAFKFQRLVLTFPR